MRRFFVSRKLVKVQIIIRSRCPCFCEFENVGNNGTERTNCYPGCECEWKCPTVATKGVRFRAKHIINLRKKLCRRMRVLLQFKLDFFFSQYSTWEILSYVWKMKIMFLVFHEFENCIPGPIEKKKGLRIFPRHTAYIRGRPKNFPESNSLWRFAPRFTGYIAYTPRNTPKSHSLWDIGGEPEPI